MSKTTICQCLAKVIFPSPLSNHYLLKNQNADLVLIDYPAGYREKPDNHVVVCPVVPCRLDYAAYIKLGTFLTVAM